MRFPYFKLPTRFKVTSFGAAKRLWIMPLWKFVREHILSHIKGFYIWLACTLCVATLLLSLGNKLLLTGLVHSRLAFGNGQHVVYHLANGDIDGTPHYTKQAEASEPAESPAPVKGNAAAVIASGEKFTGHEGLAAAPLDIISEQTDKGIIPTIGHDGTVPWKYYSRPYTTQEQKPMVAIIITNLGLSKPLTEDVFNLPHTVTLSFSPYASDANVWARKARSVGFESLVDLPMEPSNYPISDPGPNGLLSSLDTNANSKRMRWTLSRYPGYVGLLAPMDEKMTKSVSAMRGVVTELTARGVLFLYRKSADNTEFTSMVQSQNLLGLGIDSVIDDDLAPANVAKQLDALAALAKQKGFAIGVAHSYPSSTRVLELWMDKLQEKGVDVVPLSAVAKKVFH